MNLSTFSRPIIFALVIFLVQCKTSPMAQVVHNNKPLAKSLLWEISGNELKEKSYLFGTIHIINQEDYFLPKGTLSALEASQKIFFEIDMADMNDLSKQMGLLSEVFMKDNKTLKDLLSKEDYDYINDHFSKMGLPMFMFERIKPMFLTVFASADFDPQGLQNGDLKSYEMEFYEIANSSKMDVDGLETIEFQMSIFDQIPYEDQAKLLVESIKTSDVEGDQFTEMIKIYKEQDIEAMIDMLDGDNSGIGEHEDILVAGRNKNWIPIMIEQMKLMPTFFAVGAGHLAGNEGVIRLLMKAGYQVKPISLIN